ncbi:hypothetical protein GPECTOR_22g864 [Gonium pectorale]|uniref:Uncharacterized protein n=1 Tax=Gonium pectorale TaxID=33097 RepID=A0A150GHE7_GONPE|nr:hypothetical protein GPECTOR_22g864 [Gonium pectorale]|eukprot:KXZ49271.1 hypothetical protein GPECTOR_22g864 [Gonium pectorale]
MDDLRALQDACLRDRQERDQWHSAYLSEQAARRSVEAQLAREAELAAALLRATEARRKAQHGEVTAAVAYQQAVLELTDLQQRHLELQQVYGAWGGAHMREEERLVFEAAAARAQASVAASQLAEERSGRAAEVAALRRQLEEREEAAAAEVAALHESYGGRLSLLEDFKNNLLADKTAAEERWARERAALQAGRRDAGAACEVPW